MTTTTDLCYLSLHELGARMRAKDVSPVEATEAVLSPEQVRSRAFEIYCERCEDGRAGDALTDWVTAERELTTREGRGRETALVGAAPERGGT